MAKTIEVEEKISYPEALAKAAEKGASDADIMVASAVRANPLIDNKALGEARREAEGKGGLGDVSDLSPDMQRKLSGISNSSTASKALMFARGYKSEHDGKESAKECHDPRRVIADADKERCDEQNATYDEQ